MWGEREEEESEGEKGRRGGEEVGSPQAGSLPRAGVSPGTSRLQQGGQGRPGAGERRERRREGQGVGRGCLVNGAKRYRQGRALKLMGHFGVNYVFNFQARRAAGHREKKVSLGRVVGEMETLSRVTHCVPGVRTAQ